MDKEQFFTCPRCGSNTILDLFGEIELEENIYDISGDYETFVYNYYYLFKCRNCDQASIFAHFYSHPEPDWISSLVLIFPKPRTLSSGLPQPIHDTYMEAKEVQYVSKSSFVVLIRKCLEQICSDQNAKGRNLFNKIKDLSDRGILPEKIVNLSTLIRFIGNIGAHDNDNELDFLDIDMIDKFFHIVADYIYSIDRDIEMMSEKWELQIRHRSD